MSDEVTKHSPETVATVEKELRYIAAIVKQKGERLFHSMRLRRHNLLHYSG